MPRLTVGPLRLLEALESESLLSALPTNADLGGDWETGCSGYEEKLCRRSNLSATLSSPWPNTQVPSNYPIPSTGGILSDAVVVCRGPHDHYERLERWYDLPVVSVPPTRWPKLKENGTMYSFAEERDMMREKIRGALRICLYNNYDRVVVGDFGLDLRGQFAYVVFAFEDPSQSTTRFIWDEMARKDKKGASSKVKSRDNASAPIGFSQGSSTNLATDMAIFQMALGHTEIARVLSARDPRYGLDMITS
ncbi:hypothetical protein J3458_021711 [Metarhizium acridum]|uniref:uncharacterized protein n=1 Tax=Metarhizium acridum TaxID=92637 RepID=UPI001C6C6F2F|nr:hypothetical protein J3458_021711 [Metarhizium acridum]